MSKVFSGKEVTENGYFVVDKKVYDLSKFTHPGGEFIFDFARGRDVTILFDTYHPENAKMVLKKYQIGSTEWSELPHFAKNSIHELKQDLRAYFKANDMDSKRPPLYVGLYYLGIIIGCFVSFYFSLYYTFASIPLGVFCALVGLHILHDGSHFTYTHNPYVWLAMMSTHDFINGASHILWLYQHICGHHPYTNIMDADPDILVNDPDVRRIQPRQKLYPWYRLQNYYVPVLYGVLGVKTRIQDVTMYLNKLNDRIRINKMCAIERNIFIGGKVFFLFYRFVLPWLAGFSISSILTSFIISDLTTSYYLAFSFQANHVTESCEVIESKPLINDDWVNHQLRTTQDYAHTDASTTFLVGALNYQAIHHIAPDVHQYFYPKIRQVVFDFCKKKGMKFMHDETFTIAISNHFTYLYKMGQAKQD